MTNWCLSRKHAAVAEHCISARRTSKLMSTSWRRKEQRYSRLRPCKRKLQYFGHVIRVKCFYTYILVGHIDEEDWREDRGDTWTDGIRDRTGENAGGMHDRGRVKSGGAFVHGTLVGLPPPDDDYRGREIWKNPSLSRWLFMAKKKAHSLRTRRL